MNKLLAALASALLFCAPQAPAGELADSNAGVFLGRRAGTPAGACTLANDRLEDGEVVTSRLQRLSSWGSSQPSIEVMVRP